MNAEVRDRRELLLMAQDVLGLILNPNIMSNKTL